jgi:PEGA domain
MSDDPKPPRAPPPTIDPNLEGEWKPPTGRSLDAEGRVVGLKQPSPRSTEQKAVEAGPDPSGLPRLSALTTGDLELARDPTQRPPSTWEEPLPYRDEPVRSRKTAIIAVVVLVLLGAGGFAVLYGSPRLTATLNAHTPKGPLVISSEPSGAELWLAGKKVGTTPWAADNRYVGKTTWEVRARGYKPKGGTFMGGEETHLDVALEKAE